MSMVLENVAAIQKEEQGIIGHLTWYSISEHLIGRDDLRKKLLDAGLDEGWMPNEIRVSDAFRRATKDVEVRKNPTSQANVFENFLVREVYSDHKVVQRNIVQETVDQKGKRLSYDGQAAILILNKESKDIRIAAQHPKAEQLALEAAKLFALYCENYSAQAIRVMVMNILKSMSPTPVRPNGGVYFIPSAHSEQLARLCTFVSSLEKGEMYKVPLIDTQDNQRMLFDKLEAHLQNTISECDLALGGELEKGRVKALLDDAKRVVADFNHYRAIVTQDVEKLERYIDHLRERIALVVRSM
ncbi:MAG: hypothetical protein BAA01_12050 [Bacillus thermozeamaize]|mgnify:FL=1|uniref:Uncharacterized protein n=1 Tax=Bacillus thermozeamaize TaxID=230954 RepID=A0A1Y3PKF0_9BACI|nr:MAG: hypothetical protein BAA01_12050 [Bacillus thermozeamaize]